LVAAIWLLVGLIMPTPDPFLIAVGGLTVGALMAAVGPSRRVVGTCQDLLDTELSVVL
jgi:hypothetical protein